MVKERLLKFISYLGVGQTKFEQLTGLSRGLVDKMSDGITARTVNKIAKAYPAGTIYIPWFVCFFWLIIYVMTAKGIYLRGLCVYLVKQTSAASPTPQRKGSLHPEPR